MTENTKYENKYLTIWMVTGAIFSGLTAIVLSILGVVSGTSTLNLNEILSFFIGGSIMFPGYAGVGLLCEAYSRGWKFGEIEHPVWIWYIFPIYTIFVCILMSPIIAIKIFIGLIKGSFR